MLWLLTNDCRQNTAQCCLLLGSMSNLQRKLLALYAAAIKSPACHQHAPSLSAGSPANAHLCLIMTTKGPFPPVKTPPPTLPPRPIGLIQHPAVQVRMSVNRGQDLRMNGGRARIELEYDVGFDDSGKIHAVDLRLFLLGGIIMGGSTVDVMSLAAMLDQVSHPLLSLLLLFRVTSPPPLIVIFSLRVNCL